MRIPLFLAILILPLAGQTAPPLNIPPELYNAFTMNGAIPVLNQYSDDSYSPEHPLIYTATQVDGYLRSAKARNTSYYGATDLYLYQALEKFLQHIKGKNVAVIGSVIPWYESILLAFGAKPTTIEYNKILTDDSRLELLTVDEFDKNPRKFDAILSISSYEHDGLGRYGDPINPIGDLESMEKVKGMLKEGGLLFLAVPVGKDCIVWNLHRVYGKLRLKALLKGWQIVSYFGFTSEDLEKNRTLDVHQPIFVLKPW